jgi:hypothetical protein
MTIIKSRSGDECDDCSNNVGTAAHVCPAGRKPGHPPVAND